MQSIRASELAQIRGLPCEFQVTGAGISPGARPGRGGEREAVGRHLARAERGLDGEARLVRRQVHARAVPDLIVQPLVEMYAGCMMVLKVS